ncbi:methylase [Streptomyces caniferus]|uniref:peptide chain release factor N(5)-glutamine methyltransferase n=1 Tax=Streptomyces caniferus TaxID=285557 RepID=A0A640S4T7_9ACTN|nr:methylase [Streptomyces caniferus]
MSSPMPSHPSPLPTPLAVPVSAPLTRSAVVTTLRAAGCVFAEDEAELLFSTARTADALAAMVERRTRGLPLEHVVGWAEFYGRRIAVDPGVFVPRRRTEFLVGQAVDLGRRAAVRTGRPTVVVDLCCGSGAVGAVLAAALNPVELYAADIEPAAVRCARRNVLAAGGRVHEGDLFDALPKGLRGRIDILVANVPYVPTEEVGLLPPEAREHEPLVALDGGADGLDVLRRVTAAAPQWLAPGGHLLVETSERQAPQAVEAFTRNGLLPRVADSDELYATVVIGTRPSSAPRPS